MEKTLGLVKEFHHAFGLPVRQQPSGDIGPDESRLRFDLLVEENHEYLEACASGDLVKVADALGDLMYVLAGTILAHGLQDKMGEVLEEIHRSNMSKLGADGKPIRREDGKVLKSELYFRPDLHKVLKNT